MTRRAKKIKKTKNTYEPKPPQSASKTKINNEPVDVVQVAQELRRDLADMKKTMKEQLDLTTAMMEFHTHQKHKWDSVKLSADPTTDSTSLKVSSSVQNRKSSEE